MAERQALEDPKALSDSVLWPLQREYYQREGIKAWATGTVPEMITTNAVMGRAYARMLVGFLRDWRATVSEPPVEPIHIIELGAGSGRFAHHFLTLLQPRLAAAPALEGLRVRHVMTDLPGGNVERWRKHPFLRRHVDAGRLDFAILDGSRPSALKLIESGDVLGPGTCTAPLVFVANYVLDSLPLDAYVVENGALDEYLVTVTASVGFGRTSDLEDIELAWSRDPIGPRRRYSDPEEESLLRSVTAGDRNRSLLFPTHAIRLIRFLRGFTAGPLLVLSADKGYSRPNNWVYPDGPYMAIHGSASFMVDYWVLAAWVRARHGLALLPTHPASSLTCVTFVLDEGRSSWPEVRQLYRDVLDVGGPDDFFSLESTLSDEGTLPTLAQVLARIRNAEWDPSVFRRTFPALTTRSTGADGDERGVILDALRRVEDLYFPIGELADYPFMLGLARWRAGDPEGALRLLRWSVQLHGMEADTAFGMALCHLTRGDARQCTEALMTALTLEPFHRLAAELRELIVTGEATPGSETLRAWTESIAIIERWPGRRAFSRIPVVS